MLLSDCMPIGWKEFHPEIPDSTPDPLLDKSQHACANGPFSACPRENGCRSMAGHRCDLDDLANDCRFFPAQGGCFPYSESISPALAGAAEMEDSDDVRWIGEGGYPLPEGWRSFSSEGSGSPDFEAALEPLCPCEE